MTHDQFLEGLAAIEERYKQGYSDQELKMLYQNYFWMTSQKWVELCGLVLAAESFRIPVVDQFTKIRLAHQGRFRRIRKIRVECDICGGDGIRMYLFRRQDRKHVIPAARCTCGNGENWPAYPAVAEAEGTKGFLRWLGSHESISQAVSAADRLTGVRDADKEPRRPLVPVPGVSKAEQDAEAQRQTAAVLQWQQESDLKDEPQEETQVEIDDTIPF